MEGINIEDAPLPMSPSSKGGKAHDHKVAPPNQIDQPKIDEKRVPDQVLQGEGREPDHNMDPKKLKRIAKGREYSQRYRLKQLQQTAKLETKIRALQTELAINSPRTKYASSCNSLLRAENGCLQQKLNGLTRQLAFKEAEYEQLKVVKDQMKQMSSMYQASYAEIFQTKSCSYQMVNMAMHQPGFDEFIEPVEAPSTQNESRESQFGVCDHPNKEDIES